MQCDYRPTRRAEAGPLRDRQGAAVEDGLVADELLAEARLAELGRQELEEGHVRRHHGELGRDRDRDPRLPGVRNDDPPVRRGEVAHAAGLRQAAHTADVRLDDRDAAALDQVDELVPRREPLSGRDPHRGASLQLGVAREVIHPQRRLEKEDV